MDQRPAPFWGSWQAARFGVVFAILQPFIQWAIFGEWPSLLFWVAIVPLTTLIVLLLNMLRIRMRK